MQGQQVNLMLHGCGQIFNMKLNQQTCVSYGVASGCAIGLVLLLV